MIEAEKMKRIYPTVHHFSNAFTQWFDGLRSIRFIHRYTVEHGKQDLFKAVADIFRGLKYSLPKGIGPVPGPGDEEQQLAWLEVLRKVPYPDYL